MKNKTKVDLITGFLGAGKTTFLKEYVAYCRRQNEKIVLIENEFGKAGIDSKILSETEIPITQLVGGCICCGQKVNFHDRIIELSKEYERILVEPSGIYTLEDFFDIMESPPVQSCCEIGSIILIIDAQQIRNMNHQEKKILYSQTAGAGMILLSKWNEEEQINQKEQVRCFLNTLLREKKNSRVIQDDEILCADWKHFKEEQWDRIRGAKYNRNRVALKKEDHSYLFQNITLSVQEKEEHQIEEITKRVFADPSVGEILRIKGYVQLTHDEWYEVNCTPNNYSGQRVKGTYTAGVNIIGQKLNRKKIKTIFNNS